MRMSGSLGDITIISKEDNREHGTDTDKTRGRRFKDDWECIDAVSTQIEASVQCDGGKVSSFSHVTES
jgi:hypothetical protein